MCRVHDRESAGFSGLIAALAQLPGFRDMITATTTAKILSVLGCTGMLLAGDSSSRYAMGMSFLPRLPLAALEQV